MNIENSDAYRRIREASAALAGMADVVKDHVLDETRLPRQLELLSANYEDIDAFLRDHGWGDQATGERVREALKAFNVAQELFPKAIDVLTDIVNAVDDKEKS